MARTVRPNPAIPAVPDRMATRNSARPGDRREPADEVQPGRRTPLEREGPAAQPARRAGVAVVEAPRPSASVASGRGGESLKARAADRAAGAAIRTRGVPPARVERGSDAPSDSLAGASSSACVGRVDHVLGQTLRSRSAAATAAPRAGALLPRGCGTIASSAASPSVAASQRVLASPSDGLRCSTRAARVRGHRAGRHRRLGPGSPVRWRDVRPPRGPAARDPWTAPRRTGPIAAPPRGARTAPTSRGS